MCVLLFPRNHRAIMACGLILLQLIAGARPAYPESRVIKCTSDTGQISFSQTGCERGTREALEVHNPKVGWINLKTVVSKFKAKSDKRESSRPRGKASGSRKGERTQKQKCWRARKSVARIARELKRGYKPARGEELRYQRAEQEDYLALFCKQPQP